MHLHGVQQPAQNRPMDKQRANAFMLRLVGDVATTLAATLLLVGDRLGLFRAMAGALPFAMTVTLSVCKSGGAALSIGWAVERTNLSPLQSSPVC